MSDLKLFSTKDGHAVELIDGADALGKSPRKA